MRGLFSWDVDRGDPELQQILIALGDCFPQGKVQPLTNHAARVGPTTAKEFDAINLKLRAVADQYPGRVFYVWALQHDNDPQWGVFRGPAAAVAAGGGT